jgi:hypothetical protein
MRLIILAIIIYFVYVKFFGDESGCEEYASEYSCTYVKEKAQYEVWYWFDVEKNDPKDNRNIGIATGLSNCGEIASTFHQINESFRTWNSRSYICVLIKDGVRMEKHR